MSTASFLSNSLIYRAFARQTQRSSLDRLSDDILVDHIISLLDLKDVISLRRVNKFCYSLMLAPVIWKRILTRLPELGIPIPKLPPTSRHTKAAFSSLEAERLVTRAISLDNNWRGAGPVLYATQRFDCRHKILSMVMLPGAQYIVTSERDAGGGGHYYLTVSIMDRQHGIVRLATMNTTTKAYDLQAKYMTVENERTIVIAYVRRDFKNPLHALSGLNPSDFSGEYIDPQYPLIYELVCVHTRLESLEALSDPKYLPGTQEFYANIQAQPPPFRQVTTITSNSQFGAMTLDEYRGEPILAVVKLPDIITFKNLVKGFISRVKCRPVPLAPTTPNQVHPPVRSDTILNIKVIPSCEQVLVIRTCKSGNRRKTPHYTMELFDILPPSQGQEMVEMESVDAGSLSYGVIENFTISDHGLSSFADASIYPELTRDLPPPPISIYCRTVAPEGIFHVTFWPTPIEDSEDELAAGGKVSNGVPSINNPLPKLEYPLSEARLQSHNSFLGLGTPVKGHILPGAHRALVYTTPADNRTDAPPILGLYSYVSPDCRTAEDEPVPDPSVQGPNSNKNRVNIRELSLIRVSIPPEMAMTFMEGVTAIAWDEDIGRVCVATVKDSQIYVLDFAQSPREDTSYPRLHPLT